MGETARRPPAFACAPPPKPASRCRQNHAIVAEALAHACVATYAHSARSHLFRRSCRLCLPEPNDSSPESRCHGSHAWHTKRVLLVRAASWGVGAHHDLQVPRAAPLLLGLPERSGAQTASGASHSFDVSVPLPRVLGLRSQPERLPVGGPCPSRSRRRRKPAQLRALPTARACPRHCAGRPPRYEHGRLGVYSPRRRQASLPPAPAGRVGPALEPLSNGRCLWRWRRCTDNGRACEDAPPRQFALAL